MAARAGSGLPPDVLVITGAGGGIGRALAHAYARPGVTLGLVGRREAPLREVADECTRLGAVAEILAGDVRHEDMVGTLRAFDARHRIDLLIACAGVTSGVTPAGLEPWETAEEVADTNFTGALRTIAPVAELMAKRGTGHLAAIGSLAALTPLPYSPAYSAAKAGLETYLFALGRLLADRGVAVSVIRLGYVETGMSRRLTGFKPFLTTPEKAALRIKKALARRSRSMSYPFVLAVGIRLLNLLPEPLARLILPAFAFTVLGAAGEGER
ncbi:MAG: SDR family NAD(P)-dependent oxidoreductase [Parvibaculum sp.]